MPDYAAIDVQRFKHAVQAVQREDFRPGDALYALEQATVPTHGDRILDMQALDLLNYMLSAPDWSVSMLEDACEIVRATGRVEIADAEWAKH